VKLTEAQHSICGLLLAHVTEGGAQHGRLIMVYQSVRDPKNASAHLATAAEPHKPYGGSRLNLATVRALIERGALIEHERLDKWRTTYRLNHPVIAALAPPAEVSGAFKNGG
jgi:hypothetical protein